MSTHNPLFNMPIYKATDYKALYEAQSRAIGEALEEIDKKSDAPFGASNYEQDLAKGYEGAAEILTQKLGNINKIA